MRTSKMIEQVGDHKVLKMQKQLRKVHELVATDHKMYLKLIEVQLHNNQEMVCQLLPEGMGKPR